ncbi:NAD(P)-binding protein [Prauserella rugosa]|uniref:Putative NAD(P)-binding protein n=1 Tax=Prauserella rugosa TaxID=43354 RepID=A0A660C962_9PSEU|nr:NAD(P)-binding protein [Prauserella rugosa]TWH18874.1 putative NAD(P)-binding protein [Prauserella rugosa]
MAKEITVVGGGLAGLVAAIEAAERGARVTLHEAHSTLGGRARATSGPHVAHDGAHVFYADGPHWRWLTRHGVIGRLGMPSLREAGIGFRVEGGLRRLPPRRFLTMLLAHRGRTAPVDRDFHSWASDLVGEDAARQAAHAIAAATYDADTGRLSAAFVWHLLKRVFAPKPPAVRWVVGGWQSVVDRLAATAGARGVDIVLGSRITEVPNTPTIVATELASARRLLGDDTLRWDSGHAALLDIAVPRGRGDRFVVFDLDEGGFHECYSAQDATVAPAGESLFQLQMPVREGERKADAASRLARLADRTVPGWRERATWHRTATAQGRTGAIDRPGRTWRDRPAIDRGGDVYLVGDMVAAPGMRGEISVNSAVHAATLTCART